MSFCATVLAAVLQLNDELYRKNAERWIGDFPEFFLQSHLAMALACRTDWTFLLEVQPSQIGHVQANRDAPGSQSEHLTDRSRIDIVLVADGSSSAEVIPIEVKTVWGTTSWKSDMDRLASILLGSSVAQRAVFVGYQQDRYGQRTLANSIVAFDQRISGLAEEYRGRGLSVLSERSGPIAYAGTNTVWAKEEWAYHIHVVEMVRLSAAA